MLCKPVYSFHLLRRKEFAILPGNMKAVVCRQIGDPTAPLGSKDSPLTFEADYPPPPPKLNSHSVRIKVAAASLNFADALTVMGKYQERPPLPFIPGSEISGVVLEIGKDVKEVKVGDRVCAVVGKGGFSEEVVCASASVFSIPEGCDLISAAGLPVAFGTSHLGLVHRAGLSPGQVLLVLGAAGGVGTAAVQIGKLCGAIVIAVARGQKKTDFLHKMGADYTIDTSAQKNLKDAVKKILDSRKLKGVDVLFDPVGGNQFKESLKVMKWGGHVVIIGFASGEIPNIQANIALVKNITIHGVFWGSYMTNRPAVLRESLQTLVGWLATGSISVEISHRFDLTQANEAFQVMLQRDVIGKVLVTLDSHSINIPSKL